MTAIWRRVTIECVVCPRCALVCSAEHGDVCPLCDKPKKAKAQKREPAPKPLNAVLIAWRCWREAYSAAKKAAYVETPDDGKNMQRLAAHAVRLATEEAEREYAGVTWSRNAVIRTMTEALLQHWMVAYLRDDGVRAFLKEARHPLRFLDRGVSTYGVPWGQQRAPSVAAKLPEELPAREPGQRDPDAAIVVPPDVRAAVARIGRGGSGKQAQRRG